MTFADLKTELSENTGRSKAAVEDVLKGLKEVVEQKVLTENEEEVRIPKFGKFYKNEIKAKKAAKVGDRVVDIPRQFTLKFKSFTKKKFN